MPLREGSLREVEFHVAMPRRSSRRMGDRSMRISRSGRGSLNRLSRAISYRYPFRSTLWKTRFLDGRLVLDDHSTAACEDLFRKRTRLARASIHVNSGEDGDRGYLPGLLIPHLMKKPD